MSYETLDHTADIGFDLESASLEELYAGAAVAFTDAITDSDRVEPRSTFEVRVRAEDRELLMVEWLEELLFLFDTESLLVSRAEVALDERPGIGIELTARVAGEPYDAERHPVKVAVKGITYHGLAVAQDAGAQRWRARVIFDI